MDKATSVKFIGQCPSRIVGSQRKDTGLHCKNSSVVVMVQKVVVVMIVPQRRAICHFLKTMRRRNRATEALDAAIPI
jgi:hypothetical protein